MFDKSHRPGSMETWKHQNINNVERRGAGPRPYQHDSGWTETILTLPRSQAWFPSRALLSPRALWVLTTGGVMLACGGQRPGAANVSTHRQGPPPAHEELHPCPPPRLRKRQKLPPAVPHVIAHSLVGRRGPHLTSLPCHPLSERRQQSQALARLAGSKPGSVGSTRLAVMGGSSQPMGSNSVVSDSCPQRRLCCSEFYLGPGVARTSPIS